MSPAKHAGDVDANARFPVETIDALREARALSAFLDGVSFAAIAQACFVLGRRCGASAMVFAMHQIQVVTMVRHGAGQPFFDDHLRALAADQRLCASVTSEMGTGGDMGKSVAALEPADGQRLRFVKQAPTVSYGAYADDLLTTVRRTPESEPSDQVAVLSRADQHQLEPQGTWDPFGMRGTCSPGYVVAATIDPGQVLTVPFSTIAPESMVPVSHILWSHLWLGIATDAFDRARAFVKAAAKRSPGTPPPSAAKLSHLMSELSPAARRGPPGLAEYCDHMDGDARDWLSTMAAILRFNNLKIAASEQAPARLPGRHGRLRASSASRTTRRSASAATCATRCRPA